MVRLVCVRRERGSVCPACILAVNARNPHRLPDVFARGQRYCIFPPKAAIQIALVHTLCHTYLRNCLPCLVYRVWCRGWGQP